MSKTDAAALLRRAALNYAKAVREDVYGHNPDWTSHLEDELERAAKAFAAAALLEGSK